MKKKEYFSPKSTLVMLETTVLQGGLGVNGGSGGDNDDPGAGKGTNWQEPEYDDDDGFGW
ncbi:MAG: hypothetical protein LUC26_03610 [Prevotella sp.]|nr:hypothetical protein [Prevotella sp.]